MALHLHQVRSLGDSAGNFRKRWRNGIWRYPVCRALEKDPLTVLGLDEGDEMSEERIRGAYRQEKRCHFLGRM